MPPADATGVLAATLGIQFQLAASLLCLALGLLLGRGSGHRPWITWWAGSFGAIAFALSALLIRYTFLPVIPLDELERGEAVQVGLLYALYAGGKLLYLFCLLAGTWLFVHREPLPRIGIGSGVALIVGVAALFMLAPTDLNPLVAWQAGVTVPVFLISGGLLAGLPPERRTRGSRMLSVVCFLVAALWLLYTPAFLEAGPENSPARLTLLRWLAGHNSYFDMLFEFLLGFAMFLAVLDDVFHEAEEARTSRLRDVAASEARLSQIIRAASEGIVLLDAGRRIVHCNPAALEVLGGTEPDLVGEPFDHFMTTPDPERLWDAAGPPAAGAQTNTPGGGYELWGRRVDGTEFPLEVSLRAVGGATVEGYVLVLRDRTQRVRAEQERARLESQVAQTARLETIGRMVSGVAHELNNPLTAILAFSQDLLAQSRNQADAEALETIVQQSQRCRMIVQDLLTFARSKRDDRQQVELGELLRRLLPALQRQAEGHGIQLTVSVDPDLPQLEANPAAIEQVITNLAVNAIQAVEVNGAVSIFVRVQSDALALVVEDDGPGLPDDVLPRLFEPFFTTKGIGKGTGLGLSVSHAIVEQHGGTLRAENRTGKGERGARFTAALPFVDRRAVSRSEGVIVEPGPVLPLSRDRRVLIIDDEAPIRSAIRRYLERRGWKVDEAGDGREALDRLGLDRDPPSSRTGEYQVIITDLKMPGVTGIEIHDRLAAVDPTGLAKLVLISGDTASAEVAEFVARLRQPLIQKPFDMRALADLLDRTAPARV